MQLIEQQKSGLDSESESDSEEDGGKEAIMKWQCTSHPSKEVIESINNANNAQVHHVKTTFKRYCSNSFMLMCICTGLKECQLRAMKKLSQSQTN